MIIFLNNYHFLVTYGGNVLNKNEDYYVIENKVYLDNVFLKTTNTSSSTENILSVYYHSNY